MKNLKYSIKHSAIMSACVLVLISILSCSSSDDSPPTPSTVMPTLTLENGEEGIYLGVVGSPTTGILTHTIKATAPDGFVSLEIFKIMDDVASSYLLLDVNHPNYVADSNSLIYTLNYVMNDIDEPGHGLRFKAVVTDANNNTAILDFAEVDLRLPMLKRTLTLKTKRPAVVDNAISSYLQINGINVTTVNHQFASNTTNDQNIAFAFSYNDISGFYIGSLSAVEPILSNGIQEKSTTKFKTVNGANDISIFSYFSNYDTHVIENGYETSTFSDNNFQQKARYTSSVGTAYYFLTDDNRVGIFQTKSYSLIGDDATVELDLYVSQ